MYRLLRGLIFRLDSERAHNLALTTAGIAPPLSGVLAPFLQFREERLEQQLFGHTFPNPVGLAAGFDKSGTRANAWPHLGFGFAEIGSVSAQPAPGNPKPRAFRLVYDEAVINRMGLNNDGAEIVASRLESVNERRIPLGINIARTHVSGLYGDAAIADFVEGARILAPLADYLVVNISCPNTEDGKTFEEPDALNVLLETLIPEVRTIAPDLAVLVKVSPPGIAAGGGYDFGPLEDVARVALSHAISGFVATNTTSDRVNLITDPVRVAQIGRGGLSGAPLTERALETTRRLYELTEGEVPIIGIGGINSVEAAYARIRAGASLIQLYTGLIYHGPRLVVRILRGLIPLLEKDGFSSIADAVGADHR